MHLQQYQYQYLGLEVELAGKVLELDHLPLLYVLHEFVHPAAQRLRVLEYCHLHTKANKSESSDREIGYGWTRRETACLGLAALRFNFDGRLPLLILFLPLLLQLLPPRLLYYIEIPTTFIKQYNNPYAHQLCLELLLLPLLFVPLLLSPLDLLLLFFLPLPPLFEYRLENSHAEEKHPFVV